MEGKTREKFGPDVGCICLTCRDGHCAGARRPHYLYRAEMSRGKKSSCRKGHKWICILAAPGRGGAGQLVSFRCALCGGYGVGRPFRPSCSSFFGDFFFANTHLLVELSCLCGLQRREILFGQRFTFRYAFPESKASSQVLMRSTRSLSPRSPSAASSKAELRHHVTKPVRLIPIAVSIHRSPLLIAASSALVSADAFNDAFLDAAIALSLKALAMFIGTTGSVSPGAKDRPYSSVTLIVTNWIPEAIEFLEISMTQRTMQSVKEALTVMRAGAVVFSRLENIIKKTFQSKGYKSADTCPVVNTLEDHPGSHGTNIIRSQRYRHICGRPCHLD